MNSKFLIPHIFCHEKFLSPKISSISTNFSSHEDEYEEAEEEDDDMGLRGMNYCDT